MNKNFLKIVLSFICIILIVYIIYKIVQIYALFESEAIAIVKGDVGNWNIIVNSTKISTGVDKKFTIDEVLLDQSANVKEGKIAPGRKGTFYITIVPENTDVSIKYDIKLEDDNINKQNIKINYIEEIENGDILTETDKNTYTGVIPLNKIQEGINHKIKVSISWENNEENNEKDTLLGGTWNSKLTIPITVSVTQYLNEPIESNIENNT